MSTTANVFVLGLDDLNLQILRELPDGNRLAFHPLLSKDQLLAAEHVDLPALLDKAQRELDAFNGSVDAIVGYWDFPVSSMVPILSERSGTPHAALESVVKCEHKYWSRLEQQQVIDDHPRFGIVPLDAEELPSGVTYPAWLKPVKSASSELAFRVEDPQQLRDALAQIREGIDRLGDAFDFVLDQIALPPHIAEIGGTACLAEEAVDGRQFTVEGYAREGEVTVYGIVESVSYSDSPSFLRYQYPADLPEPVSRRMVDNATRVVRQVGLQPSTFNIEFFWDPESDAVNLLEVNPRHSQSHARLFEYVDGTPNHQAMVRLGLGEDPALLRGLGEYDVAAKWFLRRFDDALVTRVPTEQEMNRVAQEIPGLVVDVVARQGKRLRDLPGQDSYSFELANIYCGARDQAELIEKYELCVEMLPFEFADV